MSEETTFLTTIRQTPSDDTARLVYADWLEEQGDPTSKSKAEFIRLELRMAEAPEKGLNHIRWLNKLQKLAVTFDPAWLSLISHPKLEGCRLEFQFQCPKQWDELVPGGAPTIRFCESCNRDVYYCNSLAEARDHAVRGNCIAVSLGLARRPGDVSTTTSGGLGPGAMPAVVGRVLGSIVPTPVASAPRDWVPLEPAVRRTRRSRRASKKNRQRDGNIERENWEKLE